MQKDPGNSDYIAKTWQITPGHPVAAVQVLASDRARFLPPAVAPFRRDEESSGIIEVTEQVRSRGGSKGGAATG